MTDDELRLSFVGSEMCIRDRLTDAKPRDLDELPETRTETMIGRSFRMPEALSAGREKRVQIGDTFWRVTSQSAITSGTRVTVVAVSDMCLELEEDRSA